MCVESVTSGTPQCAKTLKRCGFDGAAFDAAAGAGGEVRENLEDEGADGFFVIGDGLDVHERAR